MASACNRESGPRRPRAGPGPFYQLGAVGGIPPGHCVVEGGDIPYKPEALAHRKKNRANRWKDDPEVKCYMPGIPRATYLPYPFQIVQGSNVVIMAYSFASTNYVIEMRNRLSAARAEEAQQAPHEAAPKK